MNCQEFSDLLDVHGIAVLETSACAALEAHAAGCGECAAALGTVRALRADTLPLRVQTLPTGFAARVLGALEPPPVRRSQMRMLVLALAGIGTLSFAGLGVWRALDSAVAPQPAAVVESARATFDLDSGAAPDVGEAEVRASLNAAETQAQALLGASAQNPDGVADAVLADGEYFVLLRFPPEFPSAAFAQAREGSAVVEFTVTADGDVAEARIVESTDPIFEASSLAAVSASKYKPRVVGGRAVAVPGVRNKIVFAMALPSQGESAPPPVPAEDAEPGLPAGEFWSRLAPIVACIDRGDLACTELGLDEFTATYPLNAEQRAFVERIYGFVHLRRGDYERALQAYENVLAAAGRDDRSYNAITLMTIARIHYERRQYQAALDHAVEYLKRVGRPTLADYAFVDRLRELGAVVK